MPRGGVFVLLGAGLPHWEQALRDMTARFDAFCFVNATSERLADALYSSGDVFLMPSLYEPCGISQMLAMRDGQLPVVNAVGGLKDTAIDQENGFAFHGRDLRDMVEDFISTIDDVLWMREKSLICGREMRERAPRRAFPVVRVRRTVRAGRLSFEASGGAGWLIHPRNLQAFSRIPGNDERMTRGAVKVIKWLAERPSARFPGPA
ncbi:MAG: glycosyltransferase [Deltaproteobacteria bacterium]|nr:glycosyltransferase [Deltaproteobacteria bacterium]